MLEQQKRKKRGKLEFFFFIGPNTYIYIYIETKDNRDVACLNGTWRVIKRSRTDSRGSAA